MKNTFLQLMKNSNKQSKFNLQYKLAVLGDCATQHLSMALRGYGYEQKISIEVFQAEYNQITSEILDDQSNLYKFTPDGVLIQMCSEKLYEEFCKAPTNQRSNFAKATLDKIEGYWQGLSSKRKMSIMQFNFAENNDMVFGNFGASLEQSYIFQLRKLNFLMQELALTYKNVSIIDIQSIQVKYGRDVFFDEASYYSSKIPISLVALPQVCAQVVQVIQAMLGRVKKCIVLDLDNTLWGGVIGDDGMGGIQIGELGIGHAFTEFQMWLKELKRRGILLAV
ncbi:MAG: FkbH domain-containing protein, partial [Oscillospiraceae bacterium]